jgi:hypothetical protein
MNPDILDSWFWGAFDSLPHEVQRALRTYWRSNPVMDPPTGDGQCGPIIEYCPGLYEHGSKKRLATTDTRHFTFDAKVLSLPTNVAKTLMAHELCHAYFRAIGQNFAADRDEEDAVLEQMHRWGYEQTKINSWLAFGR